MSIKKLQDLLNTGSQSGREPQKLCTQSNKSPSFGHGQFSPMGTNLVSAVNRSPSYSAIPGVQNMFYHPLVKNQQETVCPSPMFQVPTKKNPQTLNSLFQGSRFTAVETNPTTNHSTMNGNNASSSINSLLNQLQPQFTSQPRNLEELLQRSFTSMPSGYQSPFTSSMQSPFMYGNNNQSSNPQPSIGSDLSKILNPMTLLETSLQNNNFLSNQSNKPSSNEAVNKALILQLADILKQESESKIKSAIAELILKYRALGLLNNLSGTEMLDLQSLINGTEAPQQNAYQFQQHQAQPQPQPQQFHQEIHPQIPQQSTVPLSNGFSMNAINRNDPALSMQANLQMYKPNLQQTRVDNARKELFALNEIPIVHQQQHQAQPQPQQFHQEIHPQIPQQSAVPLSNGFSMNAINRNDPAHSMQANLQMYKPNLQQTRVDNARKELFALNEIPIVHQQQQHQQQHQQHQPAGPFQENTGMMQESLFGSNQHHSHLGQVPQKHPGISPINTLNQEMDSLSINMNTHNFSNFGITSTISAPERIDDLVPEDLGSILKNKVPSDEELPGVYNKYERINKILKYKNKIRKWRREHPVKRVFKGRSVVAGQKPRIKGKFVTLEEYSQHLTHDYKEEYGNSIKEEEF